ncbi:MAG: Type 1 glutamine amidotransferase-like domain-containing protein [Acidimicrobiales bacterium]
MTPGPLVLVGGAEWRPGCDFDAELLAASGATEVLVLPTAAAYEHPERAVESARAWFTPLGGQVRGLMVLSRSDAEDEANAAIVRDAAFIYLGGGSPLHLRSVLKASAVWEALTATWRDGATLAGSSAGAMVLTDPMVDPRGGAFTLGLGLVSQMAVVAHAGTWSHDRAHRTISLAPAGLPIAAIDERTALVLDHGTGWRATGVGSVAVWLDGREAGLDALPR